MRVPFADRGSFLVHRRARALSEAARAAMDRAPVFDDDGRHCRTSVVGVDPVRVLLFGSGPLIGYGVTERRDAVDGHLADLLAKDLGRGITVESRVRLGLPIREAVQSLGGAGTVTFSAAVWSPRFGQELEPFLRSAAAVRAMLQQFREVSDIPLVLCHLPTPLGTDWRTMLRRPRVAELNRILDRESRCAPRVVTARTGTYRPSVASSTVGPTWHRQLAEHLAPSVLELIPDIRPAAATSRA